MLMLVCYLNKCIGPAAEGGCMEHHPLRKQTDSQTESRAQLVGEGG